MFQTCFQSSCSKQTLKEADVLAYGSHFAVSRATYATMYSSSWRSGYTYDPLDMIFPSLEFLIQYDSPRSASLVS